MMVTITKSEAVNTTPEKYTFMDPHSIDWAAMPVGQSIDIGPFKIEVNIHIDSTNILDSYFEVKISAKIPWVGQVTILSGRIDKNNPKIDASVFGVGAAVVFDINTKELYADLHAFGYNYHVSIYKF